MLEISPAHQPSALGAIRDLFREYAGSLGFDLSFQDFEGELASLPGEYAPPRGRLLLARVNGEVAGCVALRPIDEATCEMKRLFLRPVFRGAGAGKALVKALLLEARAIGYGRMRLDTVPSMAQAQALYRSFGFREIPPYRHNPIEGAVYMELDLAGAGPTS